jgi:hypothetical protein
MNVERGTHSKFECTWEEFSGGPPIIPQNPDRYPAVTIKDPEGQIITNGVANRTSERSYLYEWFVPLDATLTAAEQLHHWTIEWDIITLLGQQLRQTMQFDVIDRITVPEEEKAYAPLTLIGDSERLIIRFDRELEEIGLQLVRNVGDVAIFSANTVGSDDDPTMIHKAYDGGQVAYWIDTPTLGTSTTSTGQYIAIWRSREKRLSPQVTQLQYIRVPEPAFWRLLPSLRMFIDKLHKATRLPQAYTDGDCYEYLTKGIDIINRYSPPSSWNVATFPYNTYGLEGMAVEAAGFYALAAQYISEVELGFEFTGQTVTLTYDHAAGYSDMMGRIMDDLNAVVPPLKVYVRRWGAPGSLGVRPMPGELGRESRIIPFTAGMGVMDNLTRLGLLI